MKLATLKSQSRDGSLVVVSRDLKYFVPVPAISPNLQTALDNWGTVAPLLNHVYDSLNKGEIERKLPFDASLCMSPLPRAYQWADGSAYVNHVELVRKARGAEIPQSFWSDPLIYQGGSDNFIGPTDDIEVRSESWGIDFEAEIAAITGDVPMGATSEQAEEAIKLLLLVNDVSLRNLIPAELGKGFGFFQSKPSSAFSPVAVTPDELGQAWHNSRVHLPLCSYLNQSLFGCPNAGEDMIFSFADLISHAAKTRPLAAGTIIGSGTVSNKQELAYGSSIEQGGVGYSCIAELRMIETINNGKPCTEFMRFGDEIAIEMKDQAGSSVFGKIIQTVREYQTDKS